MARREQRVLIAHNPSSCEQASSFTLEDPKTGKPQGYMLTGDTLSEVQRFKQMYSSWLIGDMALADGGVYLATPVDVLFVLLPVLERSRGKTADSPGMFCDLEQMLTEGASRGDTQHPGLTRLAAAARAQLPCVCDVKEAGGECYYRLNDDLVLAWLSCKVRQVRIALATQLAGMDEASQVAYAGALLAEYLTEAWANRLAAHLGVDLSQGSMAGPVVRPASHDPAGGQPAEKRAKVDPKEAARDAARKRAEEAKQAAKAKQAQGTKKISSFFAPKPAAAK